MMPVILIFACMSFHQACVRYWEEDTSAKVVGTIKRCTERSDPGLFNTTRYNFGLIYPQYLPLLMRYDSLPSDTQAMISQMWAYCAYESFRQIAWWGLTKKMRFVSFHEACLRSVLGDRCGPVVHRIERYMKHHQKEITWVASGLLVERYPDITDTITSILNEARRSIIRDEANRNRPTAPLDSLPSGPTLEAEAKKDSM